MILGNWETYKQFCKDNGLNPSHATSLQIYKENYTPNKRSEA